MTQIAQRLNKPTVLIKKNKKWNEWREMGKNTENRSENRLSCCTPGVLGGVRSQYLHRHQEGATFSHIEGELQIGEVLGAFDFTQVHLFIFLFFFCKDRQTQTGFSATCPPRANRACAHTARLTALRGLRPSPLRTGPPPASPWRWDTGGGAPAAARRRPPGWRRPAPVRRKCCCRWRPAGWRCPPRRSGGRSGAAGETPGETPGGTGRGREGSPGRGEARPGLEVKPSPAPCPGRRLWWGKGGPHKEDVAVRLKLKTELKSLLWKHCLVQPVAAACYEGVVWLWRASFDIKNEKNQTKKKTSAQLNYQLITP